MKDNPCSNCEALLKGNTNKRHSELERTGLSKSVGFHGSQDDEYHYQCKVCGTKFIGDSMGTWQIAWVHGRTKTKLNT